MKLNLNGWKKVNSEKDHSILQNKDGHQLKVLHKALSKDTRKQLDKLEFAEGGKVPSSTPPVQDKGPAIDPKKAKEIESSAMESGWQPEKWKNNVKEGLGLAEGGEVPSSDMDTEESPDDAAPEEPAIQVGTMPMTPQLDAPQQIQSDPKALPQEAPQSTAMVDQDSNESEQASPQQLSESNLPKDPNSPSLENSFAKSMGAAQTEGDVTSKLASDQANIEHKAAQADQAFMAKRQADFDQMSKETLHQAKDLADKKIDPEAYWKDHSKIMAAIGLGLAAFGKSDAAMGFINKAIDRNVEEQKSDLAHQKNLLSMNMKLYGDKTAAEDATRATNAAYVAHKLGEVAAKAGTPMAQAKAQQAQAQLMAQYAPGLQRAATIKTLNSGAAAHMDPANFLSVAKPDQQKAVADVMDVAKETKKASVGIMSAFERAANDNTIVKSMGGIRTPGSVMAMHALLGPTFKDVEGTVRQAAMDNLYKNVTPAPGDSDKKIQEKRQALVGYIQSKGASSLAKANGIDLDKFDATRPLSQKELLGLQNGGADAMVEGPQIKSLNGVQYQKVDGGWRKVQ